MPPPSNPTNVPTYISSHSADVILSDIRPIKLKMDALMAINAFLDEFLHRILQAAGSYTTDKLRDGLLKVLPTSIGKELLLEAEVELRAYWQRTGPVPAAVKNEETFSLPLAFELLRLKCGAYSTLNDTVQDVESEARITERLSQSADKIPPAALVAPAALYLTAILEAMCEHLLSNVGRVAARDSSRVHATGQDLFVALCEDDAMYGSFKTMQVYEQIESMSSTPKARRSKSLSRSNRTASQTDLRDSSSARQRLSSESGSMGPVPPSSRSSSDKSRAKKLFGSSRSSNDGNHQRGDSLGGDEIRQAGENSFDGDSFEDPAVLQEFDNLMRSESTMKVSLTPDRLKTMESFKQEKGPRGKSKGSITPLRLKNESNGVSSHTSNSRHVPKKPSLRHVDSIIEDEEEPTLQSTQALRKKSSSPNVPRPTTSPSSYNNGRLRTTSLSTQMNSTNGSRPHVNGPSRMNSLPHGVDTGNGIPKTRRIQKNRESLDLDEVMAGSDDDVEELSPVSAPKTPHSASRANGNHGNVSASTRELLDFLNEGPPETSSGYVSSSNRDLIDFLSHGPPDLPEPMQAPEPKKGSGRLQRMMSKLSISSDKPRGADDPTKQSNGRVQSSFKSPLSRVRSKSSLGNLSSFAQAAKPIPPRPRPTSITPSPSVHSTDLPEVTPPPPVAPITPVGSTRSRIQPVSRKAVPIEDKPESPLPVPVKKRTSATPRVVSGDRSSPHETGEKTISSVVPLDAFPAPPSGRPGRLSAIDSDVPLSGRTPVSQYTNGGIPPVHASTLIDIRRLMARATNADECRVILDMFMAKSGIPLTSIALEEDAANDTTRDPYPSPCSSEHRHTSADRMIENSIVEVLLGGEPEILTTPPLPLPSLRGENATTRTISAAQEAQVAIAEQVPPLDGFVSSDDGSCSLSTPPGLATGRTPARPVRRKHSRPDRIVVDRQPNTLTELAT